MPSINVTKTNTVAFTSPASTGPAVRMPGELILQNVAVFLFFIDSVYNRGMNKEAALMFLCFSAVLTAGLAGCARTDGAAGAEKVEANYPDVWERVLPEEMRTNIANYSANSLYDAEKEKTDLLYYAAQFDWRVNEVYHIDGDPYDDVIFRFIDWEEDIFNNVNATAVVYYSFFDNQLLSKNGKHEFSLTSTIHDVLPIKSAVRGLSFTYYTGNAPISYYTNDKYIYPPKITLLSGVIYDKNIENYKFRNDVPESWHLGVLCHDPPEWGEGTHGVVLKNYWTSHKRGVQLLSKGYAKEDIAREDSYLLLQGLDEPRFVSKKCTLSASLAPTRVHNYYEYSFVRIADNVIPLPDGTFLFAGTRNPFPVFHILRMQPDMSIPAGLSNRYRWVRYKDYVGILDLYQKDELFSGRNKICPLLADSYPEHCDKSREEGYCFRGTGSYIEYNRQNLLYNERIDTFEILVDRRVRMIHACLNLALRNYIRGEFEVYHCEEKGEMVADLTPCDEKKNNNS